MLLNEFIAATLRYAPSVIIFIEGKYVYFERLPIHMRQAVVTYTETEKLLVLWLKRRQQRCQKATGNFATYGMYKYKTLII